MPGKVTAKCIQPVQLFPGLLFFPLIFRRVYQIIKAGIFNMLQIQNHFVEPTEKAVHQFRIIFDTIKGIPERMVADESLPNPFSLM